ncbi:MAG: hypothetical protein ACRDJH_18915 [Thermomicrobiales bacterium]
MALPYRQPSDDELIERYILPEPFAPDRAKLAGAGVSVWVLVDYLRFTGGDVAATAAEYEVSTEAVAAAQAYYERHRDAIDARITLHRAAFV